jgi:DNA-binding transcriptional LysR family regulator
MSQPPLGALRAFEAVARHGSFSRAADELCVTQSAVSHQVRGLEDWLGGPLFHRSGNRVTLLPHGADLATTLGRSLAEIEAACQRARRAGGPPVLTVAAIPSVATCWLIPRLGAFRATAPDVELRMVYAIHGHAIAYETVDLAILFAEAPPARPGLRIDRLLPGDTVAVASPHLGLDPDAAPAAMLRAGLLHDTDRAGWRAWLDVAGAEDLPVAPGPVFEDFNLLRAAALAGQGVALCPLAIIGDDLRERRLVRLAGPTIRTGAAYYAVWRDRPVTAASLALDRFRAWLREAAAVACG